VSPGARDGQAGFSLVQVVAVIAIMMLMMSAGVPAWRYVMRDAREEELIFRGGQIADAILRFQKKNGNALPTSLDVLVKGKFLRKAYKDPMSPDGRWRFLRPEEAQQGGGSPPGGGPQGGGPSPSPSPSPSTSGGIGPLSGLGPPGGGGEGAVGVSGPFIGVASTSTETKALRVFNGKTQYKDWRFIAGQPRMVGNTLVSPGVQQQGGSPGPGQPPGGGGTPQR
jgi:type II secretory pathway pseudopilin PulG